MQTFYHLVFLNARIKMPGLRRFRLLLYRKCSNALPKEIYKSSKVSYFSGVTRTFSFIFFFVKARKLRVFLKYILKSKLWNNDKVLNLTLTINVEKVLPDINLFVKHLPLINYLFIINLRIRVILFACLCVAKKSPKHATFYYFC